MKYSIGLDIGGTKCAVCVGQCGPDAVEIKAREEFPTAGKTWQEVLGIYAERIEALESGYSAVAHVLPGEPVAALSAPAVRDAAQPVVAAKPERRTCRAGTACRS